MGKTCVGGECLTIDGDEEEAEPDETGDDADEGEDETGDEVEQDLEPVCADWTKNATEKPFMLCENGHWKTLLDCPDLNIAKTANASIGSAAPNIKISDGDFAFKTCKLDGSGYGDAESCGSAVLLKRRLSEPILRARRKKCYSTTSVLTCNKQGSDYLDPEVCPNGKYCNEGACADYECQPNSVVCDGDFAYKFCKPTAQATLRRLRARRTILQRRGVRGANMRSQKQKWTATASLHATTRVRPTERQFRAAQGEFCDAGACIAVTATKSSRKLRK
jgi:hypothetical protein